MAEVLAPLRRHLDLMPSPLPETPGLLIRDPLRHAEAVLVLPPPLVPCLLLFDGAHDTGDLHAALARITQSVDVFDLARHLQDTLSGNGFLEDAAYERMRDERQRAFAASPRREAVHAGGSYPDDAEELREWAARCLHEASVEAAGGPAIAIAAPHVSPEGGWKSYGAAYRALGAEPAGHTFVVLGTSHYGAPGRFGLTRKPFATPLGVTTADTARADALAEAGGPAAVIEDYCHAVEHSVEFQAVFLQHLYGPGVRILPVLCGPLGGGAGRPAPREDDEVQRFLEALRQVTAGGDDVTWVLGIDLAHIGQRYGDRQGATAHEGRMRTVEERDRARIRAMEAGDAEAFWALVDPDGEGDPLRWCGSSPVYAFLAAGPPVEGTLLAYEQWNIDARSVVSCAGMAFRRRP